MRTNQRSSSFHPHLEALEDRRLLTVLTDLNAFAIQDEATIRAMLGSDLQVLNGFVDIGKLAVKGYIPGHNFTAFQGIGVAFGHISALTGGEQIIGRPTVLFYEPDLRPGLIFTPDPTDLNPDFNYKLSGWAYAPDYDPTTMPALGNFPADAWQVHEGGYHRILDGGFTPTPPTNEFPHGSQDLNDPPPPLNDRLNWHERLWNISFYINPNGGPARSEIHDPFRNIPGFPNGEESFFYPELPYEGTPEPIQLIEAENFDMAEGFGWDDTTAGNGPGEYRLTDVDIAAGANDSNGFHVLRTRFGEFLQYTLDLPTTGVHELAFRMANNQAGSSFHIEIDDVIQSGPLAIPNTGSTSNYTTFVVPFAPNLLAGRHRVRVVFDTNASGNSGPQFDSFSLTPPAAPTAVLSPVPTISNSVPSATFTVVYHDNAAINRSSIDLLDVRVTGPNGFDQAPTLFKTVPAANSGEVRATYSIDGPGGTWDPSDAGTYHVVMNSNQVSDTFGNFVAGGDLGFFLVAVPHTHVAVGFRGVELRVNGTDSPEDITFAVTGGQVHVLFDRREVGTAPLAGLGLVIVRANGGDDTVTISPLALKATVEGGPGNDSIVGGRLADILRGGPGNDQFDGLGGTDHIFGEEGRDRVLNGSGDVIDLGPGQDGIIIHGTVGNDVIHISRRVGLLGPEAVILLNDEVIISTYVNGETITVFAGGGDDRVVASNKLTWQVEFFGEEGDDVLVGGPRDDILVGGPGADVLNGGGGLDQLFQEGVGQLAAERDQFALLALLDRSQRNKRASGVA